MVSCLMGDSTALASAIVRCCPKYQASQFESLTDFTMQLIFGTKTLENDLATFENDWKNNGGEEVRAELQAYIDSKQ